MNNLSNYNWKNRIPNYIQIEDLSQDQQHKLMHSKYFCMLPWLHLHAWPDGRAYPCCLGKAAHPVGNFKEKSMREIWNDEPMRAMRRNMLADSACKEKMVALGCKEALEALAADQGASSDAKSEALDALARLD